MQKSRFLLRLTGQESDFNNLKSMLDNLRTQDSQNIEGKSTNLDILNSAVSFYTKYAQANEKCTGETPSCESQTNEDLIITSQTGLDNLNTIMFKHGLKCANKVDITLLKHEGYGKIYNVECAECKFKYQWKSSLQLNDGKDFVTLKLLHGYFVSGMQKVNMKRFTDVTGIGQIHSRTFKRYTEDYSVQVHHEMQSSCDIALTEEIVNCSADGNGDGVDIITDARHSTRRNARYTDVVCIGYTSGKVIDDEIVSRIDDQSTQRHELLGTKRIYNMIDNKNVKSSPTCS